MPTETFSPYSPITATSKPPPSLGQRAIALKLDASRVASLDGFITHIKKSLEQLSAQKLDFLVNNAGTSHYNLVEQTTEDELNSLYDVHVKSVFFLIQKVLPLLCDGGKIINISSGLTRFAFPGSASYASMKGAVEVLTRYLAKKLGPRRITVNTVAPGAIETDFGGGMVCDNPQMNEQIAGITALGRVGLPDDNGKVVASLPSNDHYWVNAQRIEASGGTLI